MKKYLVLILGLALAAGFTCAAYAEVQNVKVGGDLTTMGISRSAFNLGSSQTPILAQAKSSAAGLAMIAKLKIDADLTDAVAVTMLLRNERIWGTTSRITSGDLDIDLAAAFVTLKEFLNNEKVTLKVGQMPVRLGSGFIVGDPDTNRVSTGAFNPGFGDFSSRKAFTGGLAILDYSPVKLTLAGLKVTETSLSNNADDVNAYIANVAYDTGVKKTVGEVYYVLRDAKKGKVNNYGTRLVSVPVENLSVSGEFVYQTQRNIRSDKSKAAGDTGILATADYALKDVAWTPSLGALYLRVSDNWNSMFEDLTAGDIINAILPLTDCQVIGANVSAKPMEDVTLKLAYTNARLITRVSDATLPVWVADNSVGATAVTTTYYNMTSKKNLGNEVDLKLLYDYTEDVQLGLCAGYFNPGGAFDNNNNKSASQVIGSMKVTF